MLLGDFQCISGRLWHVQTSACLLMICKSGSVFSQYKWRGSDDFLICMCRLQRDQSYHHSGGKGSELSTPALHMFIPPNRIWLYPASSIWFRKLKNGETEQAIIDFVPSILVFVDKITPPCLLSNFSSIITPLILALYLPNNTIAIAEERIPIVQYLYILFLQIIPLRDAVLSFQRRRSKRS